MPSGYVRTYKFWMNTRRNTSLGGGPPTLSYRIVLRGDNNVTLGALNFTDDEPPSIEPGAYPNVTMPLAQWPHYIDALRNEEPLFFEDHNNNKTLRTHNAGEVVGEDDGRTRRPQYDD